MIFTFISSLTCFNHHQKLTPSLPCMLQVHICVRHLGLCHYLWCMIVHKFYSSKKTKSRQPYNVLAECKMNKKMPGLSTRCKAIIIWVYYPHSIRTCVKVPYNLEKFHTVKFLKNFNVKISIKLRKFREIFHHYSHHCRSQMCSLPLNYWSIIECKLLTLTSRVLSLNMTVPQLDVSSTLCSIIVRKKIIKKR